MIHLAAPLIRKFVLLDSLPNTCTGEWICSWCSSITQLCIEWAHTLSMLSSVVFHTMELAWVLVHKTHFCIIREFITCNICIVLQCKQICIPHSVRCTGFIWQAVTWLNWHAGSRIYCKVTLDLTVHKHSDSLFCTACYLQSPVCSKLVISLSDILKLGVEEFWPRN